MDAIATLTARHLHEKRPHQALKLARVLVAGRERTSDWRLYAAAAQQCGELALAAKGWAIALDAEAGDLYALVNLAECELAMQQYGRAAEHLAKALALDAKAEHPAGVRARVLILKTQRKLGG